MPDLKKTRVVPQPQDCTEIDEVWSFLRRTGHRAWVWIALSFQSRQVLAMVLADRRAKTCPKLWERLPEAYRQLSTYTDFYEVSQKVIPPEQHQACKKGSGLPHAVERFHLTLRQRLGRMVRKTLWFWRSWAMHLLCLGIFIDGYNRYCLQRFPIEDPKPLTT